MKYLRDLAIKVTILALSQEDLVTLRASPNFGFVSAFSGASQFFLNQFLFLILSSAESRI